MPEPTADFDPRFDPRFQPGYDPGRHGEHHRGQRQTPIDERSTARSEGDVPVLDAEDLAHGGALDGHEPEIQDAAATPPRSGTALLLRNPFLWVILVLGAAILAWGWNSYSAAVEATTNIFSGGFGSNEETQAEYAAAQFSLGIAPFACAVGALVLVGALFFAAVTWRRERGADR